MKFVLSAFLLFSIQVAHANPCARLLRAANALDLSESSLEYDLIKFGHLKVSTPIQVSLSELKEIFAQRPIFNAPGGFSKVRDATFRRAENWKMDTDSQGLRTDAEMVIPELKEFGLAVGRKLEAFLKAKLPQEDIIFESFILRWASSAINLKYDNDLQDFAHMDGNSVYLNSVLIVHGNGTIFWNDNKAKEADAPSGQTQVGDILILSGKQRSNALGRTELATLHAGPFIGPETDRLLFLFYFGLKAK